MMEHTGLIDIIEEKIKRFSSGEYLLGSEIKDILLSEEFVIGPLEDEILGEVYEFIYFKNEGVPERYPCDLYKSKLDYILKINKKGVAAYEHKKNKKTFMDYLYFCLKSMKDIDIAAREWSKLQKIYIRDTENKEIEDKLKHIMDVLWLKVVEQHGINIYKTDETASNMSEELKLCHDNLNDILSIALNPKSEKCYDFEKNNSFNAYIVTLLKYKKAETNKKQIRNDNELSNYHNIEDNENTYINSVKKVGSIEESFIDKESGYRIFEALLKIFRGNMHIGKNDEKDILEAEAALDKKMSIYQSILSYNIIRDMESKKTIGVDAGYNTDMDLYLKNEHRIYSIIRKTLVVFLKEGRLEDFYDLYSIIIANIRQEIKLEQMQENLRQYFYESGITEGKIISRQTVSKYIQKSMELKKELRL